MREQRAKPLPPKKNHSTGVIPTGVLAKTRTQRRDLLSPTRAMTVAGVMSGTSADGIDVALCRITSKPDAEPAIKLLHHRAFPYPVPLRRAVLAAMNAEQTSATELARLNWRLGQAYTESVTATVSHYRSEHARARIDLVGCHGQTIYHQGVATKYAGRDVACTWQLGEMALVAEATGVPVVSNFRPADMAAGGQGAPLVPLLDVALFRHPTRGRVLQNLGGIGNLTAIPPGASPSDVQAFDTGPANMVIDALTEQLFAKPYDRGGRIAARGRVSDALLSSLLRDPFFRKVPPKSAGREQYGAAFVANFLAGAKQLGLSPQDALATATALTAHSIRLAYERFVRPSMGTAPVDSILSGGGARNGTLVAMLTRELAPLGCTVSLIDDYGLASQAKEAVAFALLAWQTWHRLPGNVPSATGARKPVILGQITYV